MKFNPNTEGDAMNQTMTPGAIGLLGTQAAEAAMKGAADYIKANGLRGRIDLDQAVVAIKATTAERLPEALDDVKAALACGMDQVATHTFLASMRLAGIAAIRTLEGAR